ncbi:N-acetylglucosamine kinase [Deinococcus roseus]|uniref:ATPase n=1 Tax=Deinococcus roseus TaxID=392414 RepID=A0ABQ2CWT8_9DEIO|nr:BadF/BadG/BcrA/BcrD ATPase family protein [Deinococcus roseus]GGJ28891.1 ATPase [Deinococcus roseus]
MDYVLGLDGGGSKTAALLLSETGSVLGPFYTSGVNPFDNAKWKDTLNSFLNALPQVSLVSACFGLPGYGEMDTCSRQQEQTVQDWISDVPHDVVNDVQVAFEGAFCDQAGVLMLAGTGSMAWGSGGQKHIRVGGWGEQIGDEGSAHWIGHQALSLLTQTLDGRLQDEVFRANLLETLSIPSADPGPDLLSWFYTLTHPRSQVAALAQQVDRMAQAGNPTAQKLLSDASSHLACHIQTAWTRLGLQDSDLKWSYAGSLFKSQQVLSGVKNALPEGTLQEPLLRPLSGAVWHAAKKAGWDRPLERVRDAVSAVGYKG